LSLHYDIDQLKILIVDNGRGFHKKTINENKRSGAGLNNMNKRANVLNGKTIIQSNPESGTSVYINIPY
jgi:signal transduction histidine kinase